MSHATQPNTPKPDPARRQVLKASALVAATAALGTAHAAGARMPARKPRLVLRRREARGHANHGWLDARHTFSFASYVDRNHMGFRALRVMNEDHIAAGRGFPMHPHDNMEIVTYVLGGALQHKDNMGNGSIIRPGDVQRMSAGTGIRHSEFNPSRTKETHLYQIWMLPGKRGIAPSWEQKRISPEHKKNRLTLIASPKPTGNAVHIATDVHLHATLLDAGHAVVHTTPADRHTWIQVARGTGTVNGVTLRAGDGVRTSEAGALRVMAGPNGMEALVFDLA